MSKQFQIYLDMDGVISNWCEATLNALGGNTPEIHQRIVNSWSTIDDIWGEDKVVFTLEQLGAKFWADLEIFPWTHELFSELNKVAPTCFFTNQGRWPGNAIVGKLEWLKKHGFDHRNVLFGEYKWLAASPRHFLVDDKPTNVEKFKINGGRAYLWPCQFTLFKEGYHGAIEEAVASACLARDAYLQLP